MYQNNKKKNRIILVVGVTISLLLIILSIVFYKDQRKSSLVEGYIKDIFLTLNKIVAAPFNKLKDSNCDYNENKKLYDDELVHELNELKSILQINNLLHEHVITNSTVINRNLGYWYDTITIDKGSNDGIGPGMPAVVNSGLIGKVIEVTPKSSVVRLLTSESNNKISVKVETENDYAYGLLTSYDEKSGTYRVEGISQITNIKNEAVVTTTGLGDIFPGGILIGKVTNIESDSYDLSQIIEVLPSVNFNSISLVSILKRNAK